MTMKIEVKREAHTVPCPVHNIYALCGTDPELERLKTINADLLEFANDLLEAIRHHKGNVTGMWGAMDILEKNGRAAIAKAERR